MLLEARCSRQAADVAGVLLSDAFLFVHDNDGFVDELVDAISACPHLSIEKLEPIFVKELALVYSIISFGDIRDEAYNFGNKEAMIRIIFGQDDNAWVYTEKDTQLDNRRYAYHSFRKSVNWQRKADSKSIS